MNVTLILFLVYKFSPHRQLKGDYMYLEGECVKECNEDMLIQLIIMISFMLLSAYTYVTPLFEVFEVTFVDNM